MQLKGTSSVYHVKLLIVLNTFTYFNRVLARNVDVNSSEGAVEEIKDTSSSLINSLNSSQELNETITNGTENSVIRTKRQSGGGKYADAAKMSQVKVLRLWLQMFANSWSKVYVGGVHPLHPNVPKPVVFLFKQRIGDFLFPKLDADKEGGGKSEK